MRPVAKHRKDFMNTRKIALVTGGSRGLGRNMALHLAREGHDVILTYRTRADEAADVQAQASAPGGPTRSPRRR